MNAKVHCTHLTSLYELDPRNSNHTFSGPLAEYAMVREVYLEDLPLRVRGMQVLTPKVRVEFSIYNEVFLPSKNLPMTISACSSSQYL